MKKYFALASLLLLAACKKDAAPSPSNQINPPPSITNYAPLTTGSYWIYDWYLVDSSGNSTFLNLTDSISITGDTIIGLDTFAIAHGGWYGGAPVSSYFRDSIGYLISPDGRISFSATNYIDTLYTWNSSNGNESGYLKMDNIGDTVTVPAGTFSTLNAKYIVVNNAGTWPCLGIYDVHDNQYAYNVGKVRATFQITTDPSCKVYEQRLRSYYIN
ncbi:MAG TPA: hypothetical protein VI731_12340 [Bacteroidia bacterium]|nr:hypothetical protein [Bacteroidia bacterium]